jgi:hypothetical protein
LWTENSRESKQDEFHKTCIHEFPFHPHQIRQVVDHRKRKEKKNHLLQTALPNNTTWGNLSLSWVNKFTEISRMCSSLCDMLFIRKQAWEKRVDSLTLASLPVSVIRSSWNHIKALMMFTMW